MPTFVSKTATIVWHPVRSFAATHKIIATIVAVVLLYGGYYTYGLFTASVAATRYVTTNVATDTVIATLSESGTMSATSNVSIAAKAAGTVLGLSVKPGTHIAAGTLIAKIDPTDALQTLSDAKLSLETAQLSYEKSTASSTALELLQAKNAVTTAQVAIDKAHDAAYASIASIYTDMSDIISGLDSVQNDSDVAGRSNQKNIDAYADIVANNDGSIAIFKNSALTSYTAAVAAYNKAVAAYKATDRSISDDDLVALAQTTYTTAETVADAVRNSHDFFDRVNTDYSLYTSLGTPPSTLASLITSINGYTSTITSDLSGTLSVKTSIISAEQTLAEAQDALTTAEEGPDDLTVKSAALTLKKAQETVTTAEQNLDDCYVRAPFSGTLASIAVDQYQTVGSGNTVATMVSDNEVATLTVSEADVTKIKPGQKAMLTFDALPDVQIAGTVASLSTAGSVSSGVVSYTVDVALDTNNADVKPGMSVTADIITDTATGLVVPSSAIKTSGQSSYVLVFDPPITVDSSATNGTATTRTPNKVTVVTGLAGDKTTIITNGLSEGAQVVVKTSTSSSSSGSTSSSSSSSSKTSSTSRSMGPGGGMMMGL